MKLKLTKGNVTEQYELLDTPTNKPYLKVNYPGGTGYISLSNTGNSKFTFNNMYPVAGGGELPLEKPNPVINHKMINITNTTATATWEAPTNTIVERYDILLDNTLKGKIESLEYTYTGLMRGSVYSSQVCAVNEVGKSEVTSVMFRTTRSNEPIVEVFPINVLDLNRKDIITNKDYVVFMPPSSFYIGDTKNVEIIEVD